MDATSSGLPGGFRRTPLAVAMDFRVRRIGPQDGAFEVPHGPILDEPGGDRIDPAALLPFMDHALGATVVATTAQLATTTIDFRVEWLQPFRHGETISAVAHCAPPRYGIAFGDVVLTQGDDGAVLARATGAFLVGRLPGGGPAIARPRIENGDLRVEAADFRAFTGVLTRPGGLLVPPARHLIGAVQLPAFHGGLIASALHIAAQDMAREWQVSSRIVSMGMRFLRPAIGDVALDISCEAERLGGRISSWRARARQQGKDVALAEFVVVRGGEGDTRLTK